MSGTEIFLLSALVICFIFTAGVLLDCEMVRKRVLELNSLQDDRDARIIRAESEVKRLREQVSYLQLQPLIEEYCSIVGHKRHSLVGCNVVFYGDTVTMEITLDGRMYRCNEVVGLQYIQDKLLQVKNIRDIVNKK
jgi:hypothetical protein